MFHIIIRKRISPDFFPLASLLMSTFMKNTQRNLLRKAMICLDYKIVFSRTKLRCLVKQYSSTSN